MREHITVIPADSVISVDGEPLRFPFAAPENMHALQWYLGKGHIEYADGSPNRELEKADYRKEAAPFVVLWQAEKRRLEEEANRPPSLEEARQIAFARLKEHRLAVEYAGPLLEVDGTMIRFPSEIKDETRLNSLAALFQANPASLIPDWKVADGVYVTMSAPLLQRVQAAGFAHIAATFSVERQKREEIEAMQQAEDLLAWLGTGLEAGWPL